MINRKTILAFCTCFALLASGCDYSINGGENSQLDVISNHSKEELASDSPQGDEADVERYHDVYGQYALDVQIKRADFDSFFDSLGVQILWDIAEEVPYLDCRLANDEFITQIYILENSDIAEEFYESAFVFGSDYFKVNEDSSKKLYVHLSSVVQIGNVVAIGENGIIVPLVQKYVADFEPKVESVKRNTIEKCNFEIDIGKISQHMSSIGFDKFQNSLIRHDMQTSFYGFLNFDTDEFCYIFELEKDTKKFAEFYFNLLGSKQGYSFLYTQKYILVSKTDFWEGVLNEIK